MTIHSTIWQSTRNALIPSSREERREKERKMERQDHPMAFAFDRFTVEREREMSETTDGCVRNSAAQLDGIFIYTC